MNFELSEEQQLLQQTVQGFLEDTCPPARVRERIEGDDSVARDVWRGLSEIGLAGVLIPERFGGAGLEVLEAALVAETFGRCAAPAPLLGHTLAGAAIAWAGSDAQREAWLPRLASGECTATVAFAEGEQRWLPADWCTSPGPTVTGDKQFVPVDAWGVDCLVVGTEEGGLALVDPDGSGVEVEPAPSLDRTRPLAGVSLRDAHCEPLAHGSEGTAERVCDLALVLLAADAFGGADRCVEMAVDYAKQREQFGQTIAHFQSVKHRLADMAAAVEPVRGLYWYAAYAMDHAPEDAARMAALAKAHISDVFMQTARDTVEIHGGIGFTWECDVQLWFKRAMYDRAFLGLPSVHRRRAADLAAWNPLGA